MYIFLTEDFINFKCSNDQSLLFTIKDFNSRNKNFISLFYRLMNYSEKFESKKNILQRLE